MCKVAYFFAQMDCVLADKINVWLFENPGYRVATMSVLRSSAGYDAWVAFEPVR